MKPTRFNWKIAAAAGTALGAGFGGIALASPSFQSPEVPAQVQVETTVADDGTTTTTTTTTATEAPVVSTPAVSPVAKASTDTTPDSTVDTVPADSTPDDATRTESGPESTIQPGNDDAVDSPPSPQSPQSPPATVRPTHV